MGKYIITFEDYPQMKEDGVKFYSCNEAPWWYASEQIISKLTPYTEPDLDAVKKEAYQRGVEDGAKSVENWNEQEKKLRKDEAYQKGLNDAWDAARKLWEYNATTLNKIFNKCCYSVVRDILRKYSASEVIEKIRKYEQEQKDFKVGDEVISDEDIKGVTVDMDDYLLHVLDENGVIQAWPREDAVKTGGYFPEIAEVLRKMREKKE